jgi:hypothetical protein
MKRPAAIAAALAFLFLLAWQACADDNLPKLVREIQPAVITIIAYDAQGKTKKQGSGFFINQEGHFITNYHVMEGASRVEVKTFHGWRHPVKGVLAENRAIDLVLAAISPGRFRPPSTDDPWEVVAETPIKEKPNQKIDNISNLKISSILPEIGERVAVVGSPMGLEQTLTEGVVSAIRHIPDFGEILQITAPISPGSSGSPVVNMKGEVVGITTFLMKGGQNLNFAIPGSRALALKPGVGRPLDEWEVAGPPEPIPEAAALFQQGLKFHTAGKLEKAIDAYKRAIRVTPDFTEAHINLGAAYYRLGHYQKAAREFQTGVHLEPDNAEWYCRLGSAYLALFRYQGAANAYKQAIRIDPNLARAHYFLGLTHLGLGNQGAALEEYKILKTIDPKKANELFNRIYE